MKRKMAAVDQESAGEPRAGALWPAPAEEGDFLMGFGLFPGNRLLTLERFPFLFSPIWPAAAALVLRFVPPSLVWLPCCWLEPSLLTCAAPAPRTSRPAANPFPRGSSSTTSSGCGAIVIWSRADRTRLFALSVTDAALTEPCEVGLLVPASFGSLNIQTGQEFRILVEVDQDGLLRAVEIKKA
jgi:hypothetical protein